MSRAAAIARAHAYFDRGEFFADLRRRVAIPSTSQEPDRAAELRRYLDDEMGPTLVALGFSSRVLDNAKGPPILIAERIEDGRLVTIGVAVEHEHGISERVGYINQVVVGVIGDAMHRA